jgi:hypothetical protein
MISKVMNAQQRRLLLRPRIIIYVILTILLLYVCLLKGEGARHQAWRQAVDLSNTLLGGISPADEPIEPPIPAPEPPRINEDEVREQFKREWEELGQ